MSGAWKEGKKLDGENQLAKSFQVSRVVIREAIGMLRAEHLVVTKQGVGSFVANPSNFSSPDTLIALSTQAYEEFIDFRNSVQVSAMKISIVKASNEDYERIQECLDRMESFSEDVEKYSQADFEFHFEIIKSAHNLFLEKAYLSNQNALTSILREMNSLPKSQRFGVDSHALILEDLRSKNIKSIVKRYSEMAEYNQARLADFLAKEN